MTGATGRAVMAASRAGGGVAAGDLGGREGQPPGACSSGAWSESRTSAGRAAAAGGGAVGSGWIRSDDILRTEDELFQEMMRELGFQRRGKNVVTRLTAAITQSAPNAPGHHGPPRRLIQN